MKKIFFLMAICFSSLSQAAAGDWTGHKTITTLVIENNRAVIVLDNEVQTNYIPAECVSQFMVFDLADDHGKAMYALVLEARMNDKKINVTTNGCYTPSSRPLIDRVRR